jgi:hypothetical protein
MPRRYQGPASGQMYGQSQSGTCANLYLWLTFPISTKRTCMCFSSFNSEKKITEDGEITVVQLVNKIPTFLRTWRCSSDEIDTRPTVDLIISLRNPYSVPIWQHTQISSDPIKFSTLYDLFSIFFINFSLSHFWHISASPPTPWCLSWYWNPNNTYLLTPWSRVLLEKLASFRS